MLNESLYRQSVSGTTCHCYGTLDEGARRTRNHPMLRPLESARIHPRWFAHMRPKWLRRRRNIYLPSCSSLATCLEGRPARCKGSRPTESRYRACERQEWHLGLSLVEIDRQFLRGLRLECSFWSYSVDRHPKSSSNLHVLAYPEPLRVVIGIC